MGAPIAGHLLAAGTSVAVFDPSEEAVARLAELGAVRCSSAADVAAQSDLVLVVVVDDEQVRRVVNEAVGAARAGTVIGICASVRPDTCRELARAGSERGVDVIDV